MSRRDTVPLPGSLLERSSHKARGQTQDLGASSMAGGPALQNMCSRAHINEQVTAQRLPNGGLYSKGLHQTPCCRT